MSTGFDNNNTATIAPVLDVERYRARVSEIGVSDEDAEQFLRALWFIMCTFVEFGMSIKRSTDILPFLRDFPSAQDGGAISSECTQKFNEHVAASSAVEEVDS